MALVACVRSSDTEISALIIRARNHGFHHWTGWAAWACQVGLHVSLSRLGSHSASSAVPAAAAQTRWDPERALFSGHTGLGRQTADTQSSGGESQQTTSNLEIMPGISGTPSPHQGSIDFSVNGLRPVQENRNGWNLQKLSGCRPATWESRESLAPASANHRGGPGEWRGGGPTHWPMSGQYLNTETSGTKRFDELKRGVT